MTLPNMVQPRIHYWDSFPGVIFCGRCGEFTYNWKDFYWVDAFEPGLSDAYMDGEIFWHALCPFCYEELYGDAYSAHTTDSDYSESDIIFNQELPPPNEQLYQQAMDELIEWF